MDFDVVAAAADPGLALLDDDSLLAAATANGRAVVTDNARDFGRIAREWASFGQHHAGVIITSRRRFNRAMASYPGNLVRALSQFLRDPPVEGSDWVLWL